MRNGFSFKNIHSSAFEGVTVRTKDRPLTPSPKTAEYAADNMHGSYDFTDYTGQTFYNARTVQVELYVPADNLGALQSKMTKLSTWLTGKGDIIFDDLPAVKYIGRVSDSISYMPEHGGKKAVLAVTFRCEPFAYSLWDEFDGPTLDAAIPLDSDIMLSADEYLTVKAGTHVMEFYGDVPVSPVIKASGSVKITVTNELGTYTITSRNPNGGGFTIDCEKKQVYSDTKSLMLYTTGDFPILTPENNTITVSGSDIEIHYNSLYFYNRG